MKNKLLGVLKRDAWGGTLWLGKGLKTLACTAPGIPGVLRAWGGVCGGVVDLRVLHRTCDECFARASIGILELKVSLLELITFLRGLTYYSTGSNITPRAQILPHGLRSIARAQMLPRGL